MTTTFETAKIGDRVWSIPKGWGKIINIAHSSSYPLIVSHDSGGFDTFTIDGYFCSNSAMRSLFWDEVKIEAPHKPLPDLPVDTKVLVWSDPSKKHRRHFSHFRDGYINTFDAGATSFSKLHKNSTTCWPYWELAE